MPLSLKGRKEEEIIKGKLLLVEGEDEVNFIKALCRHLKRDDIQVREVGGKDKFKTEFPNILKRRDFRDNVKSYGIVRDADACQNATFQSVQSLLKKNSQPYPRKHMDFGTSNDGVKAGVFIMPGDEPGMLENLCLKTIDHPIMGHVEGFIEGLSDILPRKGSASPDDKYFYPKNIAKAKIAAFLSGMYEHKNSLGLGAQAGYFDLNSSELDDFKEFIRGL